jgi:tetratricopeptide (TPR) repeat protein
VSDPVTGQVEIEATNHLLPYGVGGDYIGARRARRAFRLMVLSCVALSGSLYFAEHYLRYSLDEVHYRMALTLEDDSQRAILRNVVRRSAAGGETPSPRFVAALAYIEEDDMVLERYAQALALAPDDGELLTVYGCKLYQLGAYKEARRIFREAGLKSDDNALPDYLQAAAIAASSSSEEDFRTAVALVARTNDGHRDLVFPQPLWHESLPRYGYWYARMQRDLTDLCCAPLYSLKNTIVRRVHTELAEDSTQGVDTWLYQLRNLGQKLVGKRDSDASQFGTSSLIAGLKFQSDAVELRQLLGEREGREPEEKLDSRATLLQEATSRVVAFEGQREQSIAQRRKAAALPIFLGALGLVYLLFVSLVAIISNRVAHTDKSARAVRQTSGGIWFVGAWNIALFVCLVWILASPVAGSTHAVGFGVWVLLLIAVTVASVLGPFFALPSATSVCSPFLSEPTYGQILEEARGARRRAFTSLAGRFLNIALGSYVCLMCLVQVGFRVFTGLYPTDIKLLVSGGRPEELALVQTIQSLF